PKLSWYKDGRKLTSADGVMLQPGQWKLLLTRRYKANADLKSLFSTCSWCAVPPGVDRVEPVEPVTVVQGSLVTLTCEARGFPLPTLTWMKDGQPLSLHRNLLLDGQETRLQLPDVTRSDEGLYSCVASNQAGSSTKSFNLTVLAILLFSSRLTIPVNSPLELECSASGVPPPTISWLKDGRPLEGAGIRSDAGIYTCTAKNLAGRASHDMRLVVQGEKRLCLTPPRVVQKA
uniref:Ig-like domain-containing protein n=1 Tax=Poecilia latipinna TaxID=48699 RepID=A0A3B3UCM9_9TELE